jgi:hypothetical protein
MGRRSLLLLAVGWLATAVAGPLPTTYIKVGDRTLTVEVAGNQTTRNRGLMERTELAVDHGMLFVYHTEAYRSFWMKNTPLALDIAFLDNTGLIVDIQTMTPLSMELHNSAAPARYALEVPAGWFAAQAVHPGAQIDLGCVADPVCRIDAGLLSD